MQQSQLECELELEFRNLEFGFLAIGIGDIFAKVCNCNSEGLLKHQIL